MKISKVLYTSKTLADGSHPVLIRISHKGAKKYISTGQSCKPNHWSKTKDLIGSKDPNSEDKNTEITVLYLKLQNRLSEIKQSDITPSIDLLLSDTPITNAQKDKSNLISVYELKAKSCKAPRTQKEYRTFQKVMQALYGDYVDINTIDQAWVNELRKKIDTHYTDKNSQKNHFIKCFKGAYSYAEEIGLMPYRRALKIKSFYHVKNEKFLSNGEVSTIISAYKKDIVAQGRHLPPKQELALFIFILMMAFQGISNIDLAGLRLSDIKKKSIRKIDIDWERYYNDEEYRNITSKNQEERQVIVVRLPRRKTDHEVEIVADYISIAPILDKLMLGKNENDYLIPCFSARTEGNPKKEIERCSNFYSSYSKHLNDYFRRYCEMFPEYTLVENLTYYQARAAFANQVADMDIPHNLIQKMLGQKRTVLEKHYLKPPSEWEQSEISYKIFNKSITIADLLSQQSLKLLQ